MDVRVSIIMPVYNAMPYLEQSVRAVQAQTMREWELLLIDDGSADGSGALADELAAGDSRIRVIHQQNAGVSAARNAGLDAARGQYIGFVDADDLPTPEMFERLYTVAEEHACEIVTACYLSFQCDNAKPAEESSYTVKYTSEPPFPPNVVCGAQDVRGWLPEMHEKRTFLFIWRRLFSAALIRENGIRFDPAIAIGEDTLFCLECFLRAQRVIAIPDLLYRYRYTSGSAMRALSRNPKCLSSFDRLHCRKKELCLPLFAGQETVFLRALAAYMRGSLLPPLLQHFFYRKQSGLLAFRRMFRLESLRDMLRYLDWTAERSRSLDSLMLRLLRARLYLPAYLLARKLFRKES